MQNQFSLAHLTILGCTPPEMIRKTKAALYETDIKLLDIELARILADRDPKTYVPAMEAAAELGTRHVISSAWRQPSNILIITEVCAKFSQIDMACASL